LIAQDEVEKENLGWINVLGSETGILLSGGEHMKKCTGIFVLLVVWMVCMFGNGFYIVDAANMAWLHAFKDSDYSFSK